MSIKIIFACTRGDARTVEWYLMNGEDASAVDCKGCSLFYHACAASRFDIMRLLYRFGACVRRANEHGTTPLSCAVFMHRLDIAQWLVEMGADVNTPSLTGCTPMFQACLSGAPLPILQWLRDKGADVCRKNDANYGPLHVAASMGKSSHVKWLLSHGAAADLHARDVFGGTPLHAATAYCNPKCAEAALYLILEGAVNGVTGRICRERLAVDVPTQRARELLVKLCREKLTLHFLFVTLILPCAALRSNSGLFSLSGLELAHVAEFAGVYCGKKLRAVRDTWRELGRL